MAILNSGLCFIIFFAFFGRGFSWSQDELDMFDLVEEIGENFYDILQVKKDCSAAEIRKAYRRLSLQYHPDKNPDPDAAEIFTKIGAVAEVLRDEQKRAMYDSVLENGLPDWKQPVYYYRRVRKMGTLEFIALILTVLTVGQFLYGWAAYLEKQIVLYELRAKRDEKVKKSKGKKTSQQLEAEVMYYELLAKAYVPHISKLLPFVMLRKSFNLLRAAGAALLAFLMSNKSRRISEKEREEQLLREEQERKEREREEREEREKLKREEEKAKIKSEKKLRKLEQALRATKLKNEQRELEEKKAAMSSGLESEQAKSDVEAKLKEIEQEYDEEEEEYGSAAKKGRGGRKRIKKGKKIADLSDTFVAGNGVVGAAQNGFAAHLREVDEPLLKDKDSSDIPLDDSGNGWSQCQQKQLEWALSHYGKDVEERWEKIAKAVPGKSKQECLERYKELVKLVQSKKS